MNIETATPFFDQLMADITPKHQVVRVILESSELTFRVVADSATLKGLKAKAKAFVKMCEKRMEPPEFSHLLPVDSDTAARAALLAEVGTDGLTAWQFLQIAQVNALCFDGICAVVDRATEVQMTSEMGEAVGLAKNASSETPGCEIGS
jgi:hypothetical protein